MKPLDLAALRRRAEYGIGRFTDMSIPPRDVLAILDRLEAVESRANCRAVAALGFAPGGHDAGGIVNEVLHVCGFAHAGVPAATDDAARLVVRRALRRAVDAELDALTPVLEAARAWAAVESETPQPSSTGVGDWAERRAAARADLLAAVRGAS